MIDTTKQDFISLSEASRLYGFSHGYLKILIHRGKLPAFKKGRNWFVLKEVIDKYLGSYPKKDALLPPKSEFNSETDIFQKIASNFSSDIVKELKELRDIIKKASESKQESKIALNYFKNRLISNLFARIDNLEKALVLDAPESDEEVFVERDFYSQFIVIENRLSIIETTLKEQNKIINNG